MLLKWGNPNEQNRKQPISREMVYLLQILNIAKQLLTSISNFLMSTFFPTHFDTFVNRIGKWLNENEQEIKLCTN